MKKIVWRITFQTVWLNVKTSRSRKTGPRQSSPRLTKQFRHESIWKHAKKKYQIKAKTKQFCYVSEQDKPDQCVISDFELFSFKFPSTYTRKGISRFECGYREKKNRSLSSNRMICFEYHLWFSMNTMIYRFLTVSNRTFLSFNINRILYRLLSRFMTVTNAFRTNLELVLECAE